MTRSDIRLCRLLLIGWLICGSAQGQSDALFSKSFADGSKARLTSSTITELRSRPRSANPDAPETEIYSDRAWNLVTFSLLLKRPTMNKEELLWEKHVEYHVVDPKVRRVFGTLAVKDVLLIGDRAYVLYAKGYVSVDNLTRNKDGEWLNTLTTELAMSTDVSPIVKWIFTAKAKPQIVIDFITNDKVRSWIWNLKGEQWKWVKK